jgi:peptidoglycan glycosyltransferase
MPAPYVVSSILGADGRIEQPHRPGATLQQVMRPETAAHLTEYMVLSVDQAYAQAAKIPGVQVAGKTGTAEVGQGRTPHSWFVGFAPADNPRVAIAAIMENRGSGSDVATPAARRVLEAALAQAAARGDWSGTLAASSSGADVGWPAPDPRFVGAYCPLPGRG